MPEKIKLKSQYDCRKQMWKIMKRNSLGKWERFGSGWKIDRDEANKSIGKIINNYPEMYEYYFELS